MPAPTLKPRGIRNLTDVIVVLGVLAGFAGVLHIAKEWERPLRTTVEIDLGWTSLPVYALNSLARGWLAYACSLVFTVVVGLWAHRDVAARRFILPGLDILQSLPVLSFMPGLVFALVGLFPRSNTGLEIACVLMVFTGQVWNMTLSFYDSLCAVPPDFRNLAKLQRLTAWQTFWRLELPCATQGLVYNSMVSMAGGWFFLSINEAFRLGNHDFRLPGLGAYMSVAVEKGDIGAQIAGAATMTVVILAVDRLVWWPLTLWSKRFRLDDFGGAPEGQPGWVRRLFESRVILWLSRPIARWNDHPRGRAALTPPVERANPFNGKRLLIRIVKGGMLVGLVWGGWGLTRLLLQVTAASWQEILVSTSLTSLRVLAALLLGTLWTVPAGVLIGLNPRLAKRCQPLVQFAAAFPAPMVYPWILGLVLILGGDLRWGSIPLILLGTQWYILFNVIAAAAAIPNELRSAADLLRFHGWRRWRLFLLPAIFPNLVTGWIAAAGGAWNATIVSEYVHLGSTVHTARGLGSYLSRATENGLYPEVAASAAVMALCVVAVNITLWRKLQAVAQERCRYLV